MPSNEQQPKPGLKPNDPRVVQLSRLAAELFPGRVFFIALASVDESEPIASIGNVDQSTQVTLLRALLRSFDGGLASKLEPVPVNKKRDPYRRRQRCQHLDDKKLEPFAVFEHRTAHDRDGVYKFVCIYEVCALCAGFIEGMLASNGAIEWERAT